MSQASMSARGLVWRKGSEQWLSFLELPLARAGLILPIHCLFHQFQLEPLTSSPPRSNFTFSISLLSQNVVCRKALADGQEFCPYYFLYLQLFSHPTSPEEITHSSAFSLSLTFSEQPFQFFLVLPKPFRIGSWHFCISPVATVKDTNLHFQTLFNSLSPLLVFASFKKKEHLYSPVPIDPQYLKEYQTHGYSIQID